MLRLAVVVGVMKAWCQSAAEETKRSSHRLEADELRLDVAISVHGNDGAEEQIEIEGWIAGEFRRSKTWLCSSNVSLQYHR